MKMSGLICHYLYENTCSLQKQQPVRAGRGSKESPAPRGHQIGGASLRATQNPRAVAPSRLGLVRGGVSGWGGAGGSPASSVGVSPLQSRTQKGSPARLGDLTPAREGAGGLYGVFSKWVERATRPSRLATRQPEWPDAPGFSNAPMSEKRVSPAAADFAPVCRGRITPHFSRAGGRASQPIAILPAPHQPARWTARAH